MLIIICVIAVCSCGYISYSINGTKKPLLAVVDRGNKRVLLYLGIPTANQPGADLVLGQPDFFSDTANSGGLSAQSMSLPQDVLFTNNKLFVSDSTNHRIQVWNQIPNTNFQAANFVLGQVDLVSGSVNGGGACCTPNFFDSAQSMASDGTRLFVSDFNNNRVLIWNSIPTSTGQSANTAVGRPDLTSGGAAVTATGLSSPYGIFSDGQRLAIADRSVHRVLIYNSIPTVSGQAADIVLGQLLMNTNVANNGSAGAGIVGADSLQFPISLCMDENQFFLVDQGNNRILVYNGFPTTTRQAADFVIGQADMNSSEAAVTASGFSSPRSLACNGGRLFISDSSRRVLMFRTPITRNGISAEIVIGQADMNSNIDNSGGLSRQSISQAAGVWVSNFNEFGISRPGGY